MAKTSSDRAITSVSQAEATQKIKRIVSIEKLEEAKSGNLCFHFVFVDGSEMYAVRIPGNGLRLSDVKIIKPSTRMELPSANRKKGLKSTTSTKGASISERRTSTHPKKKAKKSKKK